MQRSTLENLRAALAELRELRQELQEAGMVRVRLPQPKLRAIEAGETWVRDPEEGEDDG